ncbi:MAG: AAA family ATPase [Phycisphaerales bacterium]|nr:AAA family ATPase [Phycisphaerales bacterium]
MTTLRIFVSSPGDVGEERSITAKVIAQLREEFEGRVELDPIFWEHEPLRATASFQEQLPKPSETDLVILILWSRLGTRLPAHITRPDGSMYASGTEFEFEDALNGHRSKGTPDLMVYRKTARPVTELDSEEAVLERLSQKKALEGFVAKWFRGGDGSFTAAFHAFESPAAYEQLLEEHLRKLLSGKLKLESAPVAVKPKWQEGSPFRGLQAFDMQHAPIFFGRTKAIGDLLNAFRKQAAAGKAFVLVLGMSGCGKSSLVRAGLLPNLIQPGVIEGIGLWRHGIMRPADTSGDLIDALAATLLRPEALPELESSGTDVKELAQLLRESPKGAVALVKSSLMQAAAEVGRNEKLAEVPQARLALFVDQLEEMFTLEHISATEREAFVRAISELARSGMVWVSATLRSDFYARCVELPELIALKEGTGQYDLLPPTPSEIGQMILQPARMAGLRFEENPQTNVSLDDVLREEASRDPEALPLLEFALDQLYKRCGEGGVLTYAAYEAMGGVEQALATHAEEVFQSLPKGVQGSLGTVLGALVTPGLGQQLHIARRRAVLESLTRTPQARALVESFVTHRLFVTDKLENGTAVVGVAHEALLRRWPRVANWVAENSEMLRMRARLAAAAALWVEQGREQTFLLPAGKSLAEAQKLVARDRASFADDEVAYVEASGRQSRSHRTRRRVAGLTAAVLVLALVGGWLWYRVAYVWPHVEYYANIAPRWGVPDGIRPLNKEQVSHRGTSFRLTRKGRRGMVVKVEAINGQGVYTASHDVGTYIGDTVSKNFTGTRECRWEYTFDAQGRATSEKAYDRSGRLVYTFQYSSPETGYYQDANGYPRARAGSGAAYVRFVRITEGPQAGLNREIRFTDAGGRAQPNQDEVFGVRCTYDDRGVIVKYQYIDAAGNPMAGKDGVAGENRQYDENCQVTRVAYFDAQDKPARNKDGYAQYTRKYDEYGNGIEAEVFDEQGHPSEYNGYSIIRSAFDDSGNLIRESYFEADGSAGLNTDWFHSVELEYDSRGNSTRARYLDEKGKPTRSKLQIAGISRRFDAQDNIIEEIYLDENGQPTAGRDGASKYQFKYDEKGNQTELAAFDAQGQPIMNSQGYARQTIKYDDRNNAIEWSYFDEENKPCRGTVGYARQVARYDDRGNCLEEAYYGPNGKLTLYQHDYARITWVYDDHGNKVDESYFDEQDKPTRMRNGVARCLMKYDQRGMKTETIYLDEQGRPAWHKSGNTRYTSKYDDWGHLIEEAYYDPSGNLVRIREGYALMTWKVDARGNRLEQCSYDEHRQLIGDKDGIAKMTWTYDPAGNKTSEKYFGADGRPLGYKGMFVEMRFTYDDRGNEIERRYLDAAGNQTWSGDGSYGTLTQYDGRGNQVRLTYLDAKNQPYARAKGYAIVVSTYDDRNNQVSQSYLDENEKSVMSPSGYASISNEYDSRGRLVRRRLLGTDGKPLAAPAIAMQTHAYDERGNQIEEAYFNAAGEPTLDHRGCAAYANAYDERGNRIEDRYYDAKGKLTVGSVGYARMTMRYDDRGNRIEEAYYGADDQLMLTDGGYARLTARYDERGNSIEIVYYDQSNQVAPNDNHYARVTRKFDNRGNVIEQVYFDAEGNPTNHADGNAKMIWRYDDRDHEIEAAFYDEQGNLVMSGYGYARRTSQYDGRGNMIEQSYFDQDNRLANCDEKYAKVTHKYDQRGQEVENAYFGPDGKPTRQRRGYAKLQIEYDRLGNVTARHYFDPDGKPAHPSVVVRQVDAGSAAEKSGVEQWDILINYNGVELKDSIHFGELTGAGGTGKRKLVVQRGDDQTTLVVPAGKIGVEVMDWVIVKQKPTTEPAERE